MLNKKWKKEITKMDNVLKLINRWLIILSILLSLAFLINKYTHRYYIENHTLIDTFTGEVFSVDDRGNINNTYIR
jgi:hypothetical protein